MSVSMTPLTAVLGLGVWVGAGIAHELSHAAVAALTPGCDYELSLYPEQYVLYDVPGDYSRRVDELINWAPSLIGLSVGALWLGLRGWPALSTWSVVGLGAWAAFSMPSSDDVVPRVIGEEGERIGDTVVASAVVRGGFLALTGWALQQIGWGEPIQYAGLVLAMVGIGWMGLATGRWEWRHDPRQVA